MEPIRKPMQGIWNIIRFNWHFFVLAVLIRFTLDLAWNSNDLISGIAVAIGTGIFFVVFLSLGVSLYIYDLSGLYRLRWLDQIHIPDTGTLLNIHAGFDETSGLLAHKYSGAQLTVYDFYDPAVHTELSIRRARKAYPPYPGTIEISTTSIPAENDSIDTILLMLAAHEIRDDQERAAFFTELKRILKPDGLIIVTEHLRDVPNFIAYTIGAFHFLSNNTWLQTFRESGLIVSQRFKKTAFITTFVLRKDGTTA